MLFEILMQDSELEPKEKTVKALELYYPVVPSNLGKAVEALLWFYKCGKADNPQKQKINARKGKTRVYSFEYDDDYIYAAFMTQYGIDLNSIEYMHWWKFRSMFNSLTNQCEFVKIMEYRSIDLKDNMPKEQKAFYRKMKRIYALPSMDDEDKRTNAIAEALMGSGDLSGIL
nr:MAG TPA: hypothetical protein [Caudoviricetes sp.]